MRKVFFALLLCFAMPGCVFLSRDDAGIDPALRPFVFLDRSAALPLAAPLLRHMPSVPFHSPEPRWSDFYHSNEKKPLQGMRIALDPGHVGGPGWDERTGKYLVDTKGARLSEGTMALQMALLLESELTSLGAEVLITRRTLDPVTKEDFEKYADRSSYYFLVLELNARAEMIRSFSPHITLILHFDETRPGDDLNVDHAEKRCNFTKSYVSGGYSTSDFTANDETNKSLIQEIVAEPLIWKKSFSLSQTISEQIHRDLNIPLDDSTSSNSIKIVPGVYARNLRLQRMLAGFVTSYLELLCYESPYDFNALQEEKYSININGKPYSYSERLKNLKDSVMKGIMSFLNAQVSQVVQASP